MRICLSQCPTWAIEKPPLGIAYLSAYLKSKGYEVDVLDFNIELFKKEHARIGKLWEEDAYLLREEEFLLKILYPEIFENQDKLRTKIMDLKQFLGYKRKKEILKQKLKQVIRIKRKHTKPSFRDVERLVKENISPWAKRILAKNPDVIGFSVNSNTTFFSLCVAKELKNMDQNRLIVFGGTICHANINAKFFLNTGLVDLVITGEGEIALEKVIEQFKKKGKISGYPGVMFKKDGKIINCGETRLIKNLDKLPFPDYEEFNLKDYVLSDPLTLPFLMSRGCPYNCNFCLDTVFWKKYRYRSVDNMIKEFKHNYDKYGVKNYWFNDLTINANLNLLSKFTKKLMLDDLKINWGGTARFIPGITKNIIKNMKKSGCQQIDYGLESASRSVLRRMNKLSYDHNYANKVLRWGYEAGMRQALLLIIGYINETEEEFNENLNFVLNNKKYVSEIHAGALYLLKGISLYENKEGFGIHLKTKARYPKGYEFCEDYHHPQYGWRTDKAQDDPTNRFNKLDFFYKKIREAGIEYNTSGEYLKKIIS